jgi:hypothetical protein
MLFRFNVLACPLNREPDGDGYARIVFYSKAAVELLVQHSAFSLTNFNNIWIV